MVTYYTGIPASANDPSEDQPNMLTNNDANATIWLTDHVGFNVSNGGSHSQLSLFSEATPTLGTEKAIFYPGARPSTYTNSTGGTDTNLYTLNAKGTFCASLIRAGGTFTTTASSGAITFVTQFNCMSISSDGAGVYTIPLEAVTTGTQVIVIASLSSGFDPNWSFAGTTLTISSVTTGALVSFILLQV